MTAKHAGLLDLSGLPEAGVRREASVTVLFAYRLSFLYALVVERSA
jgi:hypothetical protein